MAHSVEIERRFFIDGRANKPWREGFKSSMIKQYYLDFSDFKSNANMLLFCGVSLVELSSDENQIISTSEHLTSRIRIVGQKAILTMKAKVSHASAIELEWEIDTEVADRIIAMRVFPHVEKTRYYWAGEDKMVWEIDEFEGGLAGLILAEVELDNENQTIELPPWLGLELTGLANWSNAALANTLSND